MGDLSLGEIGGHQSHQTEPPVRAENIRGNSGAEGQWIEWSTDSNAPSAGPMITEKIGSYSLFVQGFRDARVTDSEKVLRELRGSFQGVDLQLLRADRVAGKEQITF